jgi:hypothetical protein
MSSPLDLAELATNLCEAIESLISRLSHSQHRPDHPPSFSIPDDLTPQECAQLCHSLALRFSNAPPRPLPFHAYPPQADLPDIQFLTHPDRSLLFRYLAPELLINGTDSEKSLVYSLGAISYPLFAARNPFSECQTFAELLSFVLFTPPLSTAGNPLLPLVVRCLSPDPNDRPTFSEILATFEPPAAVAEGLRRAPALPRSFPGRNLFCDFTIERPGRRDLSCHRIVLARFSRWFLRWLSAHPNERRISLAGKPSRKFGAVLNFFYTPGLKITEEAIIPLILMSYFYEIDSLKVVVNKRLFQALEKSESSEDFLRWTKELCESNLVYHALALTPRIAALNLILEKATRAKLFQSISPEVLAELYLQPSSALFTERQKLAYTEQFAKITRFEFNGIRKNLLTDRVLNWNRQDSVHTCFPHRALIGLQFNWAEPSVTRARYSLALNVRRANLEMVGPALCSAPARVSRWYFASWVWAVYHGKSANRSPSFWAVEFASRLWGIYRVDAADGSGPLWAFDFAHTLGLPEVDPVAFGLIHTDSSPPIAKLFHPRYCTLGPLLRAEEASQYFLSETEGDELPWIAIDFGPDAQFVIKTVVVKFRAEDDERMQPLGALFDIRAETSTGLKFVMAEKLDYDNLAVKEGAKGRIWRVQNCKSHCRKIVIKQSEPSPFGVNVMRIYHFDVKGHFSCRPANRYKRKRSEISGGS